MGWDICKVSDLTKRTMTTTDPIADYLTRLRNAIQAHKKVVEVPASNLKRDITRILYDKGYILSWKTEEDLSLIHI